MSSHKYYRTNPAVIGCRTVVVATTRSEFVQAPNTVDTATTNSVLVSIGIATDADSANSTYFQILCEPHWQRR